MRLRSGRGADASSLPVPQTPAPAPPAPPAYKSAYGYGIATNRDGSFDHFIRFVDQSHFEVTGHWRFGSNADESRAYRRGFATPEDILVAQDRGDDSCDDVSLRWVPCESGFYLHKVLEGSAAQHLKTIYEVRRLLSMPVSLEGHIPVYPISKDAKLKEYWDKKRNSELDQPSRLPESQNSRSEGSRIETPRRPTVSPLSSPEAGNFSGRALDIDEEVSSLQIIESKTAFIEGQSKVGAGVTQPLQNLTVSPVESEARLGTIQFSKIQHIISPQSPDRTTWLPVLTDAVGDHHASPHSSASSISNPSYQQVTPTSPLPYDQPLEAASALQSNTTIESINLQQVPVDNVESSQCLMSSQEQIDTRSTTTQSHAANNVQCSELKHAAATEVNLGLKAPLTPYEENSGHVQSDPQDGDRVDNENFAACTDPSLELAQINSQLPCMECGLDVDHESTCYIGNLELMNLTALDLRNLADAVERFDPGPWTTHFDFFPLTEPEDPQVQIKGMADVIRNEESYKNDPELHYLPDDLMILLWALKRAPEIRILRHEV